MKKFKKAFLDCIKARSITGLRSGKDHPKFTGIWMVVVEDRIFGRSYYLSERSWYNTFIREKSGEIKCGDVIVKVRGVKPRASARPADRTGRLEESINAAYEAKYGGKPHNRVWIDGLKHPDRVAHTMEFKVA